jgi:choline dehydrogenase
VNACERVGIPRIDDTSRAEGPIGTSFVSGFIDQKGESRPSLRLSHSNPAHFQGSGSSAAKAYLTPAVLARPNLVVAVETSVTRIIFSTSSGHGKPRAVGVELAKSPDAPRYRVAARREVLCCAGAIKSPQILTASGIGPKGELERLGVPVVKELEAVGKNLYDVRIESLEATAYTD